MRGGCHAACASVMISSRLPVTALVALVLILLAAGCSGLPTAPRVQPTLTGGPKITVTPSPLPTSAETGNADVGQVRAVQSADGDWTFFVTVAHPDTGWDDYADGWDVVTPEGTVLKPDPDSPFTRLLLHPHESEQPFTRSQSGIVIPAAVTKVRVRAHDLADGFGGREVTVDLTADSGPGFEVVPRQ